MLGPSRSDDDICRCTVGDRAKLGGDNISSVIPWLCSLPGVRVEAVGGTRVLGRPAAGVSRLGRGMWSILEVCGSLTLLSNPYSGHVLV